MSFDDVLLALIARRARSGYELKKWLDVEGIFIRANADQSQIYRTLRKLEKAGLITYEVVRKGGPDAKIFTITPAGAQRLAALAHEPYDPPARWQEPDLVTRISLLGPIVPESLLDALDREIAFRHEQMARFRGRPQANDVDSGLIAFDQGIVDALSEELNRFGRDSTDAWVAWLEDFRERWAAQLAQSSAAESSASSSRS